MPRFRLAITFLVTQALVLASLFFVSSPASASTSWVDPTFSPSFNGTVWAVAVHPQTDPVEANRGKIVVAGEFTSVTIGGVTTTRNRIARLNADGTIDAFAPNIGHHDDRQTPAIWSIVVENTGKVIVGGNFTTVDSPGVINRRYIARLNSDGTLDSTWNPSADVWVRTLALDSAGNILVGGDFTNIDGQSRNRVARLSTTTGSADSFNPDASQTVRSLRVQSTVGNEVIVGGDFGQVGGDNTRQKVTRLKSDGTLDSFGSTTYPWQANSGIYAILPISTTPIIGGDFECVGYGNVWPCPSGNVRNRIAKLASNGTVDAWNPNANGLVRALAQDSSGNILAAGDFTTIGGESRNRVARLSSSTGNADTFNPNVNGSVNAMAVDSDGKILIGGSFTEVGGVTRTRLARLMATPSAALNPTFSTPVATSDGFTVNVTNYDANYTWASTVSSGSVAAGTASGSTLPLTVTGLSAGASATVTTTTARTGYTGGSATVSGTASGGGGSGGGGSSDSGGGSSGPGSSTSTTTTPNTPTPSTTPNTGAVAFVPTNEKPGEAGVLIGGKRVTPTVTSPGNNEAIIRAGDLQLGIKGPMNPGTGSSNGSAIVLNPGRPLVITGDGAQPNSIIQTAIFSKPMQLASSTANAKGEFVATNRVPAKLKPGNHTLQVTGRTKTGETFVLSVGVVASRVSATSAALVRFRPASAELTAGAKSNLRRLVAQSKGKTVKQARIDGTTFYIAADFARDLARDRVTAISSQLRKLGVKQKIEKRVVPTKDIKDRQVRTYEVSLRVS